MTERIDGWVSIEHPGYFGRRKDELVDKWNQQFGDRNWRLRWEISNGEVFNFAGIFWQVYVPGYVAYLSHNPVWADWLASNFAYTYDKDQITKDQAFDPYFLLDKPGIVNQFHHAALNIALEYYLGRPFRGESPIQAREGKHGVLESERPQGWRFSPGQILCTRPDLIPPVDIKGWWQPKTIEDMYQKSKVLQVRYSYPINA